MPVPADSYHSGLVDDQLEGVVGRVEERFGAAVELVAQAALSSG